MSPAETSRIALELRRLENDEPKSPRIRNAPLDGAPPVDSARAEAPPHPTPGTLSPNPRKTDAQALNAVYGLAQDAKTKDAAHKQQEASKELATLKERVNVLKAGQVRAQKGVTQATSKLAAAKRSLKQAEVATAESELQKASTKLNSAENELGRAENELLGWNQSIATLGRVASIAREALKEAIGSHQFDFEAMSVTDLAKLSMVLNDHPGITVDVAAAQIREAAFHRFTSPSLETIDAIARASLDESARSALGHAIKSMKPDQWAILLMEVQRQKNELDKPGDPFFEKLMGKVADIEPESMKFLDEQLENMEAKWRDAYVSRLDAEIFKSVVNLSSSSDAEKFIRCAERIRVHTEIWSARQLAKPEGERAPYLADLTTSETAKLFEVLQKDPRWSQSDSGRALVEQSRSRFHACLMASGPGTAQEDLVAIAGAAVSSSYVASLTTPEVGRLFKLLQENAGAWRNEKTRAFTAQVNSRFLHHYLGSINGETPPNEIAWLSALLKDMGEQWRTGVADEIARTRCEQSVAEAKRAFGTLGSDEVAQLFLATQSVMPRLHNTANIADDVGRKFAADYAHVDLKTHQMLIRSFPGMSQAGQTHFTAVANRPPAQLKPLLDQVFGGMGMVDPEKEGASEAFLKGFQGVMEYRMSLPGSDGTPDAMYGWLLAALPVSGKTRDVAMAATAPGRFRDALKPGSLGHLHKYVDSAARAALALDQKQWNDFDALYSVSRLLEDKRVSWTPKLQNHFNDLLEYSTGKPQEDICRFHLEVLRTHQKIVDANGISKREAEKLIKTLEKMAAGTTQAGAFLKEVRVQLDLVRNDSAQDRRDNILASWSSAVATAQKALVREGAELYRKQQGTSVH